MRRFLVMLAALLSFAPLAQAQWTMRPIGESLVQISVGSAVQVVGVNRGDGIYRMNAQTGQWMQMPGAATNATVAADGTLWVVNRGGVIYRWAGSDWTQVVSPADIGAPKQISAGSASNVWLVTTSGAIFRWNGGGWTKVIGSLAQVSAAADGTVMGVNAGGGVFKWRGGDDWTQWPGAPSSFFVRIAVGSGSSVWTLTQDGLIWHWNGTAWTSINGVLTSIGAGADGTVWANNAADQIWRYTGPALHPAPEPSSSPVCSATQTLLDGNKCVTLTPWPNRTPLPDGTRVAIRLRRAMTSLDIGGTQSKEWVRWLGLWTGDNQSIAAVDNALYSRDIFAIKTWTTTTPAYINMPWFALVAANDAYITDWNSTPAPPAGTPNYGTRATSFDINNAMMFTRGYQSQTAQSLLRATSKWGAKDAYYKNLTTVQGYIDTAFVCLSAYGVDERNPVPQFVSGPAPYYPCYTSGDVDFFVVN
jgi:hypothetical protein